MFRVTNRSTIFLGLIVSVAAGVGGCTRAWYRADADRQVEGILRDRKDAALGYQPETELAKSADPPAPGKKAYATLPMSPIPPVEPSPIEPSRVLVPFSAPNPEMTLPPGMPAPQDQSDQQVNQMLRRRPLQRLILGPPAPGERVTKLDLFRSLEYAVQHSRIYQSQMEELYLAALTVTLERHLFEPRFFANTALRYEGGQADVDYRSALVATGQAGVRQRLPYGGEIVASGLVQFVNTLNDNTADGESAELALTGTIPLLRGAGMVAREGLITSERQLVYAVRDFELFRRQFAVDVASAYFQILTSQQRVLNRRTNYNNLSSLLERTRALYAAGRISFLEVQRSGQALYTAEASLIDAEASLENTVDDFKLLLGMDVETELQVLPAALDVNVPEVEKRDVIKLAHTYRLDVQTQRDLIDDANRRVKVATNALLPDLDLTGGASVGNRTGTPARQFDARTGEYNVGVQLDLPVDRLAERNGYRRSLIEVDRAQRALQQLLDSVAADVRTRVRAIRSAEASLQIQQRSIELAQRRLEYSTELLKEGKVNSRDVVEAQQSLLTAQDAFESARSTLQIEILRFLRDTGTLRVDPKAGSLGHALDRVAVTEKSRLSQ